MNQENKIKLSAQRFGFDALHIARATALTQDAERYKHWLKKDYAADLAYMKREFPRRWNPQDLMPESLSILTIAVNFFSQPKIHNPRQGFGRVARYAWGSDYHSIFKTKIRDWLQQLRQELGIEFQAKVLVDSSPLLERAFARESGLGFIGKNTLLISRKLGTHVLLAEVLLDLELQPDPPEKVVSDRDPCGSCRSCLDSCPTGALVAPRLLDARRCISFWTIEHRGTIPPEIRMGIGDWIFGCDACTISCPYEKIAPEASWKDWRHLGAGPYLEIAQVLAIKTEEELRARFPQSPLLRAKRSGLVRNGLIVAANQKLRAVLPLIKELTQDEDPTLQTTASWALAQIQ